MAQEHNWIMSILRTIISTIDWTIFNGVRLVLFGIFDMANLTTSSGIMGGIYSRIYVLLGVFMAFKLSFSFFQYIVDPDSMTGKSEKGVGKLITRAIVMIIALVALPGILFGKGEGQQGLINRAQTAFLPMLPRILFGSSGVGITSVDNAPGANSEKDNAIDLASKTMAVQTMRAFMSPAVNIEDVCRNTRYDDIPELQSLDDILKNINLTCNSKEGLFAKYYVYNYSYFFPTITGILLLIMLLGITIDVAKRVFKLIILEAIAPIPIMSLIDPKSNKDGGFSKWLKMLISTFLNIFFELGVLYLVLMLIQMIVSNKGLFDNFPTFTTPEGIARGTYLTVFLIIGLIFFAKEAPKFIKDALGIKDDGGSWTGFGAGVGAMAGLATGRGLGGMASGALAGATADPKVGAWAAGRDKAGQLKHGDSNWKGDLASRFNRFSGNRAAAKLGLNEEAIEKADTHAKNLEAIASTAKLDYEEKLHDSSATATEIQAARDNYDKAQSAATFARKHHDNAKKDYQSLGAKSTSGVDKRRKARTGKSFVARKVNDKAEDLSVRVGMARYGGSKADRTAGLAERKEMLDAQEKYAEITAGRRAAERGNFNPYASTKKGEMEHDPMAVGKQAAGYEKGRTPGDTALPGAPPKKEVLKDDVKTKTDTYKNNSDRKW